MKRLSLFVLLLVGMSTGVFGKTLEQLNEENKKLQERVESMYVSIEKQTAMLEEWKAKNEMQARTVAALKNTRKRLEADVIRMKKLLQAAGLNPAKESKVGTPHYIEYKGVWQSKYWFDSEYRDHRNEIAFLNNEYINVTQYPIASWFTVMQVLGLGDVLAKNSSTIIRVTGLPGAYIDDERLPPNLVLMPAGNFQYKNTLGSTSTVSQYTVAEVVNEEQFLLAIRKGYVFDAHASSSSSSNDEANLSRRERALRAKREKSNRRTPVRSRQRRY